jgi:hypothetical protein
MFDPNSTSPDILSDGPVKYILRPVKRVLDTEMNGFHCFNFTEKLSYEV